jgi:methionyl-tRNA synthetase
MEPGEELDAVLGNALEAIRLVTILATPAIPEVAARIWTRIGLAGAPSDEVFASSAQWGRYRATLAIEKGEPLFPRIKASVE